MMHALYPTYTLRIEIADVPPPPNSGIFAGAQVGMVGGQGLVSSTYGVPTQKYYNSSMNKTGCDEVLAAVRDALSKAGIQSIISFEKFEHK